MLTVKNPYTDQTIETLSFYSRKKIETQLTQLQEGFCHWKHSTAYERSQLLSAIAAEIKNQKESFAKLITAEAGKPLSLSLVEVDRAIGVFEWTAAETLRFAGSTVRLDTTPLGREGFGLVQNFPRGIILGITPFNFPLNLVAHKVAPALATGNVILIKPSPFAPLTALKLLKTVTKVFSNQKIFDVTLAADEDSKALTRHELIKMVSFTGSAKIGWLIKEQAPRKPITLELGGNAWCIVSGDHDKSNLEKIARRIAQGAFNYAGQSCISVQNIAVMKNIYPAFRKFLKQETEKFIFGDPLNPKTSCGPVIHDKAQKKVQEEISKAKHLKSFSSKKKTGEGRNLIIPTIIESPNLHSSLVKEEIFAPVAMLHAFENTDALIKTINSHSYGLQAGVFTQNISTIEKIYKNLDIGGLIVNDIPTTRYDHQPYGGVKDSGMGREGPLYAMEEMTEKRFLGLSSTLL